NALDQLRTNEVALMGSRLPADGFVAGRQVWELREFHLTPTDIAPHTMNLEPARDFDIARPAFVAPEGTRSGELVTYLEANATAVLASRHVLAPGMSANSSLVGASPYGAWGKLTNPSPPEIPSQGVPHALDGVAIDVRDSFALNTCAGCHRHETDTRQFMHVTFAAATDPTSSDGTVVLSSFLQSEIMPSGARFEDFSDLLVTKRVDLRDKPGLRSCR
ncbi:MAG TPA: hypothetical protein VFV99_33670, partial [Kofleriaceae bacterium]|nr:hypothetical protein [Kofleriaceae bacterium]